MYKALNEKGGERLLYRLARERKGRDLDRVRCIKNKDRLVLVDKLRVKERWQSYFSDLLNEGLIESVWSHPTRDRPIISCCRRTLPRKRSKGLFVE